MKAKRTTESNKPDFRPVILAAIVASLVMLAFALAHRTLAAHFADSATGAPIAPDALGRFPMAIGGWVGEDVPLDEAIVQRTDSDSHVSRRYSRRNGQEAITLYVTCGVNAGELLRHNPENCYSGAGWLLASHRLIELPAADGTMRPCTLFEFARNRLGMERIATLLYLIVDGHHYSDIPAVQWKVWRRHSAVRYAAEIQIITPVGTAGEDIAEEILRDFAIDSFVPIASLFDNMIQDQGSGALRESPEKK